MKKSKQKLKENEKNITSDKFQFLVYHLFLAFWSCTVKYLKLFVLQRLFHSWFYLIHGFVNNNISGNRQDIYLHLRNLISVAFVVHEIHQKLFIFSVIFMYLYYEWKTFVNNDRESHSFAYKDSIVFSRGISITWWQTVWVVSLNWFQCYHSKCSPYNLFLPLGIETRYFYI